MVCEPTTQHCPSPEAASSPHSITSKGIVASPSPSASIADSRFMGYAVLSMEYAIQWSKVRNRAIGRDLRGVELVLRAGVVVRYADRWEGGAAEHLAH
jgi:hypothetical protein